MAHSGHDTDSTSRPNEDRLPFDLHQDFALKNVKELLGPLMVMPDFSCAGRHEFFDHTQLRIPDQIPSIAIVAPAIVLGISPIDRRRLAYDLL